MTNLGPMNYNTTKERRSAEDVAVGIFCETFNLSSEKFPEVLDVYNLLDKKIKEKDLDTEIFYEFFKPTFLTYASERLNVFGYWLEQNRTGAKHTSVFASAVGDNRKGFDCFRLYTELKKHVNDPNFKRSDILNSIKVGDRAVVLVCMFIIFDEMFEEEMDSKQETLSDLYIMI